VKCLRRDELVGRPEPAFAARGRADERRRVRRRLVRRHRDPGRLPQHRAGLERPEPARARRPHRLPRCFSPTSGRIGSAVQQTNCHPFRHDRWLFMHNGYINEFGTIKRDLVLAVDPSLYPEIKGQADTEGCSTSPSPSASRTTPGRPRAGDRARRSHRSPARRAASVPGHLSRPPTARASGRCANRARETRVRSSTPTDVPTLRKLYPDREDLRRFSDDARLIVSEPLSDVAGVWNEVPESTWGWSAQTAKRCTRSSPKHRRLRSSGVSAGPGRSHRITRVILRPRGPNRIHAQAC
jgi:hypothetical protein